MSMTAEIWRHDYQNYETVVLQFIKSEEYSSEIVDSILERYLSRYPGSVTFTFFSGTDL